MIAVVGMGQLGTLLSERARAAGQDVVELRRGQRVQGELERVLVTVGEDDLSPVLASLPERVRDRVVLVQNELVPDQWRAHGITRPTVAVVWFEKKKDKPARVVLPTPIAGPWAAPLVAMLEDAKLDATVIDEALLPSALLDKNVYILVSNIAGLAAPPGTTTSELLELERLETTTRVFADVLEVESRRLALPIDADMAAAAMMRAFLADPTHVAAGRSAPLRLSRTLERAERLDLKVEALRAITKKS